MSNTFQEFLERVSVDAANYIEVNPLTRVFFEVQGKGFKAYALKVWAFKDELWTTDCKVECIITAIAYSDGIIHLNVMEGDESGYMYCPNIPELIGIFNVLQGLEERFCPNKEQ